jgi:hypothetical protein
MGPLPEERKIDEAATPPDQTERSPTSWAGIHRDSHQFLLSDKFGDDHLGGQQHAFPVAGMDRSAARMTEMGTYPVKRQLAG